MSGTGGFRGNYEDLARAVARWQKDQVEKKAKREKESLLAAMQHGHKDFVQLITDLASAGEEFTDIAMATSTAYQSFAELIDDLANAGTRMIETEETGDADSVQTEEIEDASVQTEETGDVIVSTADKVETVPVMQPQASEKKTNVKPTTSRKKQPSENEEGLCSCNKKVEEFTDIAMATSTAYQSFAELIDDLANAGTRMIETEETGDADRVQTEEIEDANVQTEQTEDASVQTEETGDVIVSTEDNVETVPVMQPQVSEKKCKTYY